MTVEQLAEQYAKDYLETRKIFEMLTQAYIAGYNEAQCNRSALSGVKWHKVADELPISDKDKFYLIKDKWNCYLIARYFNGEWSDYTTIEDVIAWCEIPTFTE